MAILPGSRTQELTRNLPIMLRAAAKLAERPARRPVRRRLPARPGIATSPCRSSSESGLAIDVEIHAARTPELIRVGRRRLGGLGLGRPGADGRGPADGRALQDQGVRPLGRPALHQVEVHQPGQPAGRRRGDARIPHRRSTSPPSWPTGPPDGWATPRSGAKASDRPGRAPRPGRHPRSLGSGGRADRRRARGPAEAHETTGSSPRAARAVRAPSDHRVPESTQPDRSLASGRSAGYQRRVRPVVREIHRGVVRAESGWRRPDRPSRFDATDRVLRQFVDPALVDLGDDLGDPRILNLGFGGSTMAACAISSSGWSSPASRVRWSFTQATTTSATADRPRTSSSRSAIWLAKLDAHLGPIPFAFISIKPSPLMALDRRDSTRPSCRSVRLDPVPTDLHRYLRPDARPRRPTSPRALSRGRLAPQRSGYRLWPGRSSIAMHFLIDLSKFLSRIPTDGRVFLQHRGSRASIPRLVFAGLAGGARRAGLHRADDRARESQMASMRSRGARIRLQRHGLRRPSSVRRLRAAVSDISDPRPGRELRLSS